MSTYLLAFVISDFPFVTNTNDSAVFRHRVYAQPSKIHTAYLALNMSANMLEALSGYLSINYTLPKMDQVAIPNFKAGGNIISRSLILNRVLQLIQCFVFSVFRQRWKIGVSLPYHKQQLPLSGKLYIFVCAFIQRRLGHLSRTKSPMEQSI